MPLKDSKTKIELKLGKSQLTVALVQIEAAFPDDKIKTVVDGRETFSWRSLDGIHRRTAKVLSILDFIHREHPETDVVVFPEYSIPLLNAIEALQRKADQHGTIIIAGSDNIADKANGLIMNRSPIVLPGREPVWVSKRELSQWEVGYVDSPPTEITNPVLSWSIDDRRFWLAVDVCLDASFLISDEIHLDPNPGMYIVPMCSREVTTLRTYADTLLRADGGRAVVLCNAVGEFAGGSSCVMAVTPGGRLLQPALELSESDEQLAIVELDYSQFAPRRKTSVTTRSAVGARRKYNIRSTLEDIQILPFHESTALLARGVVNPLLYSLFGKTLRVAFLEIEKYAELAKMSYGDDFEILAIQIGRAHV